jgi:hypothetical protein
MKILILFFLKYCPQIYLKGFDLKHLKTYSWFFKSMAIHKRKVFTRRVYLSNGCCVSGLLNLTFNP